MSWNIIQIVNPCDSTSRETLKTQKWMRGPIWSSSGSWSLHFFVNATKILTIRIIEEMCSCGHCQVAAGFGTPHNQCTIVEALLVSLKDGVVIFAVPRARDAVCRSQHSLQIILLLQHAQAWIPKCECHQGENLWVGVYFWSCPYICVKRWYNSRYQYNSRAYTEWDSWRFWAIKIHIFLKK